MNLQETLLIRSGLEGPILPMTHEAVRGRDPRVTFARLGILTRPLIAQAIGCLIRRRQPAAGRLRVMLAWDAAPAPPAAGWAIKAVRQAGATAVRLGAGPVAMLGLASEAEGLEFAIYVQSPGGPRGRWAVRLLEPPWGMPLPDEELVQLARDLESEPPETAARSDEPGELSEGAPDARRLYARYLADPRNSWLRRDHLAGTLAVISAAGGPVPALLARVLGEAGAEQVDPLSAGEDPEALIGLEAIAAGSPLVSERPLTARVLELGRLHREAVAIGQRRVVGLAMSRAGGRLAMLEYDPGSEQVLVLPPESIAFHLMRFVQTRLRPPAERPMVVAATDTAVSLERAVRQAGGEVLLAPDEDHWVQNQALRAALDGYLKVMAETELDLPEGAPELFQNWREEIGRESASPERVRAMAASLRALAEQPGSVRDALMATREQMLRAPHRFFTVAVRGTGFMISPGAMRLPDETVFGVLLPDAAKVALNALVATSAAALGAYGQDRLARLQAVPRDELARRRSFPGMSGRDFAPGTVLRRQAAALLSEGPEGCSSREMVFPEAPGVLCVETHAPSGLACRWVVRCDPRRRRAMLVERGSGPAAEERCRVPDRLLALLMSGRRLPGERLASERAVLERLRRAPASERELARLPGKPQVTAVLNWLERDLGLIERDGARWRLSSDAVWLQALDEWEGQEAGG